jgi:hypothetical protein
MGIRILDGGDQGAIFYNSTTDWAFGPKMGSVEEAEAFLLWAADQGVGDLRRLDDADLAALYAQALTYWATDQGRETWQWVRDVLGRVPIPRAFLDQVDPLWDDQDLEEAWGEMMEGGEVSYGRMRGMPMG